MSDIESASPQATPGKTDIQTLAKSSIVRSPGWEENCASTSIHFPHSGFYFTKAIYKGKMLHSLIAALRRSTQSQ
jgi:hypothetical protein